MPKIIIVEDEIIIAKEISYKLKSFDYEVIDTVNSYEKLLISLEKYLPDLILMDIMIHGEIGGIEAAKKIKESYDIPVIFLTGYSDNETVEQAKKSFPDGYLVKPINYIDLRIAIEIAIYKYTKDKEIAKLKEEQLIKDKMIMRSQRLASLGELSASIAHEIRQPLNTIKILTDSMIFWHSENKNPYPLCEEHNKSHKIITQNIDRINNIIEHMNNMIKKTDRENPKIININERILNLEKFYKEKLQKRNIKLNLNLDENLKGVLFSEIQFEQIITNLVNNAINAHNRIDKGDKFISITTKDSDKDIIIQISDNATGINKDVIEKVFDPLFTTGEAKESMGLGLYIVNKILESYESYIYCENNDCSGVTFTITLKCNS